MKSMYATKNVSQSGFTLVEIIMVILIMGIMAVIAAARFNPESFESAAATAELISAIRHAQERSMSSSGWDSDSDGTPDNFQVVIAAGGYTVTQALSGGGTANVTHPVTGAATYSSNWSGVTLSPTGTISFDGYGAPSLSGSLAFGSNQEVISVTVGSDSQNVTLEDITGFVR